MEDMKEKFHQIYMMMASSSEVGDMKIFGHAAKQMFERMTKTDPAAAAEWLAMLEPIRWHNYLTYELAKNLAEKLVNQDESKGPHWSMDTFFGVVTKLGGKIEDEPYYNKYALWLVANAHFSDFAVSTAMDMGYKMVSEVPEEKMALSMYRKAVESLKDVDRSHYIRDYYHV